MKNKKLNIPSAVLQDSSDTVELLKNIKNLTDEDVVVIYAYAEAIVETVREPLIILDEDLCIKTANKSFFDAFKVTKEETYNKSIFELGNGQWNIPALNTLLKEILPKDAYFENFEVTHTFDGIGNRTMILNARRIILEGHKTELVLLAIEDITQKKLIDKHKDDFISIASHELKTPLTSIKIFAQLLQAHYVKASEEKPLFILDKITQQIDRMERMMSSFLHAYSLQTGKLELHKEHFIFDDLLDDTHKTFQYSTETHTILRKGKPLGVIFADKERLSQVITNLLTNAIKYSAKSDTIVLATSISSQDMIVSVQDFGVGIPLEHQELIFERFFRVHSQGTKAIDGLGLGLYISHEIIQEHKGKMWVKSTPGEGSTFYFSLPLKLSA